MLTNKTKKADRPGPDAGAHDALEEIVEAVQSGLSADRQAELIRRLGNPRPDPELAKILRAWPRLSPAVRAGVASVVEGSAAVAGENSSREHAN